MIPPATVLRNRWETAPAIARRLVSISMSYRTMFLDLLSVWIVLLIYRLVTTTGAGFLTSGFNASTMIFGIILAAIVPWSMAIIASWQGWNALEGRRFKPAFKAMFLHTTLLFTLAIGLNYPWFLPIIPVLIFMGQRRADEV